MNDLRIISIDDSGYVDLGYDMLNEPMTAREEAIQRAVIALLTTPGSMIDYVDWGGGANSLFLQRKPSSVEEGRLRAAEVVRLAEESLLVGEDSVIDYRIISLSLREYSRTARGFKAKVKITFAKESPEEIIV